MHQHNYDLNEAAVQSLFCAHSLRFTRQRFAVYTALACEKIHPTADQLFRKLSQSDAGISLATVYNTLEALVKSGLAQKLADGGTSARYDAAVDDHLHIRDCATGTLSDVPEALGQKLLDNLPKHVLDEIEDKLGFRISRVQIELIGEYTRQAVEVN
jgi:Fe2+ or Zn2+ uptake regulation protein